MNVKKYTIKCKLVISILCIMIGIPTLSCSLSVFIQDKKYEIYSYSDLLTEHEIIINGLKMLGIALLILGIGELLQNFKRAYINDKVFYIILGTIVTFSIISIIIALNLHSCSECGEIFLGKGNYVFGKRICNTCYEYVNSYKWLLDIL